jgi:hypothetical protein
MPRADKVIGTIKVLQNGKAMIKALPSDQEAVRATLEFVLWWLNDRPDHPSAHRPLGFTVLDDGMLQIGIDKPSDSVTIDVFNEMMVGITKEDARAVARRLEECADKLERYAAMTRSWQCSGEDYRFKIAGIG